MDYTESEKGAGKRMKIKRNKLVSVVAMALSMALMLGACGSQSTGATASKDMIPLLDIIFSDEDVLIYRSMKMTSGEDYTGSTISAKNPGRVYAYRIRPDGTSSASWSMDLGELAQMSDEEILTDSSYEWQEIDPCSWNITTDTTGENTYSIEWFDDFSIGEFQGHTTIYNSSYMIFSYINQNGIIPNCFVLIRDTKDTMDKTVYLDTPGTEGFKVDGQ